MSHTVRFSAFIVLVMASFSLAFHALFFSCDGDTTLGGRFGTFSHSLLTTFEAALGQFYADDFDDIGSQCPNLPAPGRSRHAGMFLLVTYLIVMAVVLLNLLIAVLSTVSLSPIVGGHNTSAIFARAYRVSGFPLYG